MVKNSKTTMLIETMALLMMFSVMSLMLLIQYV